MTRKTKPSRKQKVKEVPKKPPEKTMKAPGGQEKPSERPMEGQYDACSFSGLFPLLDEASLGGDFEDGARERRVSAEHGIPLSVISRPGRMSQDTEEIQIEEEVEPKVDPKRQRRRWYERD